MVPRFRASLGIGELKQVFSRNRGAVARFEKAFAQKFNACNAVAFPYGRSAQWAFFNAIGLHDSEIIMPAYTCSVVAHAVSLSGNKPIFVDIDLSDYNMNYDDLENSINTNTGAVIATHTFGFPQDISRLEGIVSRAEKRLNKKIWLIQDCCHAFGASSNGKIIGESGDVAVYAFNISKLMTSVFGGMLTFQDEVVADKVRKWRDENYQSAPLLKSVFRRLYLISCMVAFSKPIYKVTLWIKNKTNFLARLTDAYHLDEKIHFPPDYRDFMLDFEAAVGLVQLSKYDEIILNRRAAARLYYEALIDNGYVALPEFCNEATYSHFVVRVLNKTEVMKSCLRRNVELGELIQYSIPLLAPYSDGQSHCPYANEASESLVNLPVGFGVDCEKVLRVFAEELSRHGR